MPDIKSATPADRDAVLAGTMYLRLARKLLVEAGLPRAAVAVRKALRSPEAAIAIIAPYTEIPNGLAAELEADMRSSIGVKDGAYQAEAKRGLFGSLH
ncbi:hypothetical protein [Sphingobium sp.]|uniref:hypothetical protein n=1 Tax=Sphingobium sp. TaxID=1912891 RepID=UPI0028BE4105|nr:hypothetical protein [Sphingobium sp.]